MIPRAAVVFDKLPRTLRRHKLMKWWMRFTGEDPIQLVRIRSDSWAYADMRDGFLRLIAIDGDFEHDFFRIADQLLQEGGHFFDVGANYGLLSFGLAGKFSERVRFHLFEPNPKLVSAIRRSAELYPQMRITVNSVAVADHDGVIQFAFAEEQSGASHISEGNGVPVPSVSIDAYLKKNELPEVALLKLDIEGHELTALRGAVEALQSHAIKAIYFEYFEKWLRRVQTPEHLLDFFESFGYAVYFCREVNLKDYGGPTHTLLRGLPGHGIPLRPIKRANFQQ